jgi:DNA excision repair protein ERCC-4
VVRVIVDVHEGEGVVRALRRLDCDVDRAALGVGDYVVASGVVVERKTVRDFHLAVVNGRFWRQIGAMRATVPRPYLLIEGRDVYAGPLARNAVRGILLAVLEQGVPILRTSDAADSAAWLLRLAIRSLVVRPPVDRPVYAQRPPSRCDPAEAMLAAVPGISVTLARRLIGRFGSVAGVVAATREELAAIPGMGSVRTAALKSALHP